MSKENLSYLHNQQQGYKPGTGLQGLEGYQGLQGVTRGYKLPSSFALADPKSGCSQTKLMRVGVHARSARRKA